jgi:hypothetical protein
MKLKLLALGLIIALASCASEKPVHKEITKGTPPPPPKPKYAVLSYEMVDWSECNNDITSMFNDGEFFLTIESSLNPSEKVILPINISGNLKKTSGFIQTPLKLQSDKKETLYIDLLDEDNTNPQVAELIKKAEQVGGMIIFKDKRLWLFKNLVEYVANKPWDKLLNENVLSLEGCQPCGSVKYVTPSNPPLSERDAKYMEIRDNGKLKMKFKFYYQEK